MKIRAYLSSDCPQMAALFFDTVHRVNKKDYTKEQLNAWASGEVDLASWDCSFRQRCTLIAETEEGRLIGFADMDEAGYLDRLYVHSEHQKEGIAGALLQQLEQNAAGFGAAAFTTHSSITARPFFEKHGYRVLEEEAVMRAGIWLTRFFMVKNAMAHL